MSGKRKTSNVEFQKKDPYRSFAMEVLGVAGINTALAPNAIEDNECQALWNYLPIGKGLVRKVPAPLLYATLAYNISAFFNDVINNTLTMFTVLSDGSAGIVNTDGSFTQCAGGGAGTFNNTGSIIDIVNWLNQFLLVTDSANGLFLMGYIGTQGITNGTFTSDLTGWAAGTPANLITNGTFKTDLGGWTAGTGWAWNAASGGEAKFSGPGTATMTGFVPTIGASYTLLYSVVDYTAGTVTVSCGGQSDAPRSGNGNFTFNFTATTADPLTFTPSVSFPFAINAVSMTTTSTCWVWDAGNGGQASFLGYDAETFTQAAAVPTIGLTYLIKYTINSIAAGGTVTLSCGGASDTTRNSPGTYWFRFTATAANPVVFTPTSFAMTIDNVYMWPISGPGLVPTVILISSTLNGNSIAMWQGRILIAQGRYLNYSGPLDFSFAPGTGIGSFNITSTNLRQAIASIIPYMDSVYVIGDHAIIALTGTTISSDPTTWYQMELFNTLGSIYPPAVVNFQNNIYCPNEYGLFRVASTQSVKVDVMLDDTQFTFLGYPADVAQINNLNFYLALASGYSPASQGARTFIMAYCIELQQFAFLDFGFDVAGVFTTRAIADHSLYCWSGAKIYRMFRGTGPVTSFIRSKVFDMGDPFAYKFVRFMTLDYKIYSGSPSFVPSIEVGAVDNTVHI